mgnify:CR=1 FL=1
MKGQLKFNEFGIISDECKCTEHDNPNRKLMADPCYYCLCNSCKNNVESRTVMPEEVNDDWKPCFFCDECSNYDDEAVKNMERVECWEYEIDDYHARRNRKKIKIMRWEK